jgi:hypothetical protein
MVSWEHLAEWVMQPLLRQRPKDRRLTRFFGRDAYPTLGS